MFFLENYTNTKTKSFELDKNILGIVNSLLSRAKNFMESGTTLLFTIKYFAYFSITESLVSKFVECIIIFIEVVLCIFLCKFHHLIINSVASTHKSTSDPDNKRQKHRRREFNNYGFETVAELWI